MSKIVTFTLNPAVDKSTKFAGLVPEQKIRCEQPFFDAGGGGINVSKAISRLGGTSVAVFPAGGPVGEHLKDLLKAEEIKFETLESKAWTRENFIAVDTNTNAQYRFGMPGQYVSEEELDMLMQKIDFQKPEYIVASGSLPDNIGKDFFSNLTQLAKKHNSRLIVDTSGAALKMAMEAGAYLLKPNIGELAKLLDRESLEISEIEVAAKSLIEQYGCGIIVVSMGPQGAALISKDETIFLGAPLVKKKSTVGAGDSMVGGMVWALSQKLPLVDVLKWGIACGSAATMNEGTQLFKKEDAFRLFGNM
jgi:6-phosphofructokinase 2